MPPGGAIFGWFGDVIKQIYAYLESEDAVLPKISDLFSYVILRFLKRFQRNVASYLKHLKRGVNCKFKLILSTFGTKHFADYLLCHDFKIVMLIRDIYLLFSWTILPSNIHVLLFALSASLCSNVSESPEII